MLNSSVLGKTYDIWLQSAVLAFLRAIFSVFSRSFKNSRIVHLFVRDSRVEPIYAASLFARIFKAVVDFIVKIIAFFCGVISRAAQGSVSSAFLNRYVKGSFFINFETLLGGFICLMFIVPHDYWSNTYALIASIGFFGLYFILVGAGKRKAFYLHDMGFPMLLFMIACVFGYAFSFARSDSLRVLMFFVTCLMFLYVISADITTKQRMMKLLGFIYLAVVISALYAIYQRIMGVAVSASLTDLQLNKGVPGRVYGPLDNPNNYAEFLVIMTPLAAVFAANVKRLWLRVPLCASIALPFLALMMTYSRSCWISMLLSCLVFVYFANKKLIPAFFFICVAAVPFLPDSIIVRAMTLFNSSDTSNQFRLYVWSGTIQIIRDYLLIGIGPGPASFAEIYPSYASVHALVGVPHSHMVYMELIIEFGLLGFIAFMWFMLRLWKDSAVSALHTHARTTRFALIAGLSSLVGIAFAFGVEYVWYYPRTFFAYFILAAIATAAVRMAKAETAQN